MNSSFLVMKRSSSLKLIRVAAALLSLSALTYVFLGGQLTFFSEFGVIISKLQLSNSILRFITPGAVFGSGLIVILILTLLFGRVYCSVICPLGILQDIGIHLKKRLQKKKKKLRYSKSHRWFRYSILALVLMSPMFVGLAVVNKIDPYAIYARFAHAVLKPIVLFCGNIANQVLYFIGLSWNKPPILPEITTLTFTIAVVSIGIVLVFVLLKNRLYCNTLCPVGTLLGLLSKVSVFRIQIDEHSCTRCGKCLSGCKSHCIDSKSKTVDFSRCVACYNCISSCSDKSIGYRLAWKLPGSEKKLRFDPSRRIAITKGTLAMGFALTPTWVQAQGRSGEAPVEELGPVTPPGSISKQHYLSRCIACEECVSVCPSGVLQPAFLQYGLKGLSVPFLDFSKAECSYDCRRCGEVCPTGAILPLALEDKQTTQIGIAHFRRRYCDIRTKGVDCVECEGACPTGAITMVPHRRGGLMPRISIDLCNGCGACEAVCPADGPHPAIWVEANAVHAQALPRIKNPTT